MTASPTATCVRSAFADEVEAADRAAEVGPSGNRDDLEDDGPRDEVHDLRSREEPERVADRVRTDPHARADLRLRHRHGAGRQSRHDLLEQREAHDRATVHDVAPALGAFGFLEVLGPEARELRRLEVLEALDVGLGEELVGQGDLLADIGGRLVRRDPELDERTRAAVRAGVSHLVAAAEELRERIFRFGLLRPRALRRARGTRRADVEEVARSLHRSCRRTRRRPRRSRRVPGRSDGAST